ncbi:kinase-like domain-containing protein [Rhizophagus clarus]|uniref:Kinase-like domain-containing protein n=1 Tax=Rhizophagus clarus TaxID=94130 RepID=A0A8H3LYR3_9GLOM|nr:kinase-like domain-containing protein [Rhizophagus clarus]
MLSQTDLGQCKECGERYLDGYYENEWWENGFAIAVWKDGPLYYDDIELVYTRDQNKKIALKRLCNSQNITNEYLLNEIRKNPETYGISQNPDTKDYIMVLQDNYCNNCGEKYVFKKWCRSCQLYYLKKNLILNWNSGNEMIDKLIQEMHLKINHYKDNIFEWIPYNQFNEVKEIRKGESATVYLATWNEGPLCHDYYKEKWSRVSNKQVTLKCPYNSQNITNDFLNEVKNNHLNVYGITQNPDTKEYIIVFQSGHCEKCGEQYINQTDANYKWCKPCLINHLKNSTSGIEKIDNLIQGMQSRIKSYNDIIFEWVPYDQFEDVTIIGKGGFATVYSAIWKDGPLNYDYLIKKEFVRKSGTKVALKCLFNSQNLSNEFLNEIKAYSMRTSMFSASILKTHGISQNPITKDFIMVLEYAEGRSFDYWLKKNYEDFDWLTKIVVVRDIISGLKEIHQKQMVHCDFHIGNILFKDISYDTSAFISDMGLSGEIGNIDNTKIYGVMPFVAPEVLRGNPYTKASDIYSFGMIMYFAATGKRPLADCAHDEGLALSICDGIRPEIKESEAPRCYIDLMERCWDSNADIRPSASEIEELLLLFHDVYMYGELDFSDISSVEKAQQYREIKKQINEAEEYRKAHISIISSTENESTNHPQASNVSQILNPYTENLIIYDSKNNDNLKSDCLECEI